MIGFSSVQRLPLDLLAADESMIAAERHPMWMGIISLEKELVSPKKKVKVINTVGLSGSRWSLRQLRRLTRLSHPSDTSPAACYDNSPSVCSALTQRVSKRLLVDDLRDLPPAFDSLSLRASNITPA